MTLGTLRHDTANDHLVFPPQKDKYSNGAWKNIVTIGTLAMALMGGIKYLNNEKNPETDKFMQSIGGIAGIEHIHLPK